MLDMLLDATVIFSDVYIGCDVGGDGTLIDLLSAHILHLFIWIYVPLAAGL